MIFPMNVRRMALHQEICKLFEFVNEASLVENRRQIWIGRAIMNYAGLQRSKTKMSTPRMKVIIDDLLYPWIASHTVTV